MTYFIIGLTALVSLIALGNQDTFDKLSLIPYRIKRNKSEWFRILSHGFIHGGIGHLAFNMLTLYFFGPILENRIMSPMEFLLFYLSAIVFASLVTYQNNKDNESYAACGASGAVSAVLFVLVFYEPWSKLYLYFAIPVYFILFALGYLGYSLYMSKKENNRIAHDVHFYGALYGIAYTLLMHPESLRIFINKISRLPF